MGCRVLLSEETDWLGGQLTQQAVPPDEHPWIEQFGCTRSYRVLRQGIREYYRKWYPVLFSDAADAQFNPGNCGVSRLCHEPRVALAVVQSMLMPHISAGSLTVLLGHTAIEGSTVGDRISSIRLLSEETGERVEVRAPLFLDATETGALLPLTGTEYVTGSESHSETGEMHASGIARPENHQAITWCFAMDFDERATAATLERPAEYSFWRDYQPQLEPPWPGGLLSWTYTHPITLQPQTVSFDPRPGAEDPGLWRYRRLLDPLQFKGVRGGISLVNWPQNDYWLGNIYDVSEQERERSLHMARQLSLSLLYWLQTEAPRPDGGSGWPGLRLRGDLTGTDHGLAKRPYVRESRRIRAEFTVLEQHFGTEARMELTGQAEGSVSAESFFDSVGVGSYRIDLHPSTGGDNYIDISSLPFEIPLGALLPQRMENLVASCKNVGTTHITNGCFRLHPVEWNIGEAAGTLAAFCVKRKVSPREVRDRQTLLSEYQNELTRRGVEIRWPKPAQTAR
jgi:hypothetical protein